jgi:pyruvate dehydrogenase E1 component alpha subunit
LPTLFVCENNFYSTESPLSVRKLPSSEFVKRAESFGVRAIKVDGNDLMFLYEELSILIAEMRNTPAPIVIECETYRWREHVGPYFDFEKNRTYREKSELIKWKEKDPVLRMKRYILSEGIITLEELSIIEIEVESEVRSEFELARVAPKPRLNSLLNNAGEL